MFWCYSFPPRGKESLLSDRVQIRGVQTRLFEECKIESDSEVQVACWCRTCRANRRAKLFRAVVLVAL